MSVNLNCKLCLGLAASWEGHDGDCPKHPGNLQPSADGLRAEIARLRAMLAWLVNGKFCPAPKWNDETAGLVACRECRTCEAAIAAGLTDFGTGWTS